MSHLTPKRAFIGCLSGLLAGLVFVTPTPPSRAEGDIPAGVAEPPLQVAESLLNQEPKPRPVMRHREDVPPSAMTPIRAPRAAHQAATGAPAGKAKKTKKKKHKTTAAAPLGSQSSPKTSAKASVKAGTKAKRETGLRAPKTAKQAPAKSGKRKARPDNSR